ESSLDLLGFVAVHFCRTGRTDGDGCDNIHWLGSKLPPPLSCLVLPALRHRLHDARQAYPTRCPTNPGPDSSDARAVRRVLYSLLERIDRPGAARDLAFNLLEVTALGFHDFLLIYLFAPGSPANAFSAAL